MSRPEPESGSGEPKQRESSLEEAERKAEAILADAERRAREVLDEAEAQVEAKHAERIQAAKTEYERLVKLRDAVANGLLEVSKAAARDADRLLSAKSELELDVPESRPEGPPSTLLAATEPQTLSVTSWWSGQRRVYGTFLVGLVCGFALAVLVRSDDAQVVPVESSVEVTEATEPPVVVDVPEPAETPQARPEPAEPPRARPETELAERAVEARPTSSSDVSDGLRVLLTAKEECWVRVHVDDDEPWERLMAPEQTIMVSAVEHATIRVGDASALSMSINDRSVKSLGADGQVVNLRITPSNYRSFLVDGSSPRSTGTSEQPALSAEVPDELRLTLEANEQCWVRVQLDDDEGWERLMAPDQTIVVSAEEQAVVRVGDAAALSLFINDQAARPLGEQGQVVNLRITPRNYQTFLAGSLPRP